MSICSPIGKTEAPTTDEQVDLVLSEKGKGFRVLSKIAATIAGQQLKRDGSPSEYNDYRDHIDSWAEDWDRSHD